MDVPRDFIVPKEQPWPHTVHGRKLGRILNNIKYRGDFAELREDWERLGLVSASDAGIQYSIHLHTYGGLVPTGKAFVGVVLSCPLLPSAS